MELMHALEDWWLVVGVRGVCLLSVAFVTRSDFRKCNRIAKKI